MFKHILLPLDGSLMAESALPVAVILVRAFNARITLLHVIEKGSPREIHGQRHLSTETEATEYLAAVAKKWFGDHPDVDCHVHEEEVDQVAKSIVSHTSEFLPDLIILSAHGEGGLRDMVVGSIAQQVIALGEIPVVLLQPEEIAEYPIHRFKKILVPLDGEPDHEKAYLEAIELAKKLKAALHLVRVIPTMATLSGKQAAASTFLPSTTSIYLDMSEEEICEYLEEKLADAENAGIDASAEVRRGDPAQEVVKSAVECKADLILLGTHGKSGIEAFWAGSTAPKIVSHTKLPILLYPVRR